MNIDEPVLKSFRIDGGTAEEEQLVIREDL